MKIEKVNENQIRCTLTREDLASRELKLSELAYGTEKAKNLFRDMMQQANFEFGFEAEDIPLMIEAIPLNAECIVLIITKVEDPEELDTRFSRFAPPSEEEDEDAGDIDTDMLNLFDRIQKSGAPEIAPAVTGAPVAGPCVRAFRFPALTRIMDAACLIATHFQGESTLYKDERTGEYLLLLKNTKDSQEDFDRICNILSEYGSLMRTMPASQSFFAEHFDSVVADNAIASLAGI